MPYNGNTTRVRGKFFVSTYTLSAITFQMIYSTYCSGIIFMDKIAIYVEFLGNFGVSLIEYDFSV